MGTIAVRRRRRDVPPVPSGELHVEPPPEPERAVPPGLLARAMPVAMLLGSVGIVAVMGVEHPTSWVFGGMFAMSSVGMLLGGGSARGSERTASLDEDRRDYLRYLAGLRRRARAVAAAQRHSAEHVHPPAAAWPAVLAAGRLWERDPADADFGQVRIGLGPQRLAAALVPPRTGPVDGVEPVAAQAVRRLLAEHSVVPGLPVAVDLRGPVWLDGSPEHARAVARALVVGFALWHSPADARVAVLGDSTWDWVKWLPHTAHAVEQDALGPVRMLTGDPDVVRRWWAADPEPRQLLVVVDGPDGPGAWAATDGVAVLRVGVAAGRRESPSVVRVRLADPDPVDTLDELGVAEASAAARRLARYRPEGVERRPGLSAHGLLDLLGLPGLTGPAGVAALRDRRTAADRMRVPLGVDDAGRPLLLDLKESALGGSGPHGLCVGATGSGKSELLRALVVGLVLAHGPDELNLVLVDFKGGATFLGLTGLPHVAAVITNLADELALVDRMADAVTGEITRRQEVLRAAGNLSGIGEYEAARAADPGLAPLPVLMIVVDEFSELVARRPELVDLFVTVGRLGRSLGLHLLLASQRLDEGRLRGLESHLSYRIALRTFSASESRVVLGVPDAHALPPTPGSAILSAGTDQLVRFRGAYVSGGAQRVRGGERRLHLFTAAPVAAPAPREETVGDSVLTTAVAAVTALGGPAAHRVWLPPLDAPPALADLPVGSGLRVPVGLVDRPARQRRDPLVVDLGGAAGHLAVAGGPRSGKSTALATVVRALARAHAPAELGVHVLDLGGGSLAALEDLPHVGTVAGRAEPDLVRRVLAEVTGLLARREALFRAEGIASVAEFRARRAAGLLSDEPATDVLLVVDGYAGLAADWAGGWAAVDEAVGRVAAIAHRGLAYGVHLALSVSRWGELRPAVRDQLGMRLELRLGEPGDSDVDRRRAAGVPARPGHGLAPDGDAMVVAAGPVDPVRGPAFPPVRVLPARVGADTLPADALGVDEDGTPIPLPDGHLLCLGDPGSGKTALLRLVAQRIAQTEARIVAIDPRRTLLGALPAGHVLEHAVTPTATAAAVGDLVASLTRRRPGPEVSAERLAARDWWTGPEVWVLVDDHDLAVPPGAAANPLAPLAEFLADGADLGLHVVLTRRVAGAARALFDPVIGRLRELGGPALVLHGSPDEGPLVGSVRAGAQPPGRGLWVDRAGTRPVQLGWVEP